MNPNTISKVIAALSVVAIAISIGSMTFCIMESNDDVEYKDVKYTLYIGLNVMDPDDDVENDVKEILRNEKQGYTLYDAEGGYDMGDNYITEKTVVFVINNCDERIINDIVDFVKEKYNLGIMVEKQPVRADLYM